MLQIKYWKNQLHILWLGQAVLMTMLAMSLPYWPLYIAKLGKYTNSEIHFWSAAIYAAPFITSVLSSPLWGKIGDKHGYKPMVIRACLGLFITQTLILFFSNVVLIFIFRLLQGLLAGFIVAAQAWALAITPKEAQGATMGKLQSATAIGNLLGPLLGGVIASFFGYHAIFSGSSLICALITIFFAIFLINPIIEKKTIHHTISTSLASPSAWHITVISFLLVIALMQLARAMITPTFSLFVTEQLGGSDITVGILYAATGFMVFLTASFWGGFFDKRINKGYSIHFIIALLLLSCSLLQFLHAYVASLSGIFILRILSGICLGALLPILLRLLAEQGESYERGSFLGLGNSANKLGNLLGILIGAYMELQFGYANSFLLASLLYLIGAMLIVMQMIPFKLKLNRGLTYES